MSLLRNNLLKQALQLIPGESYDYLQYLSEEINTMGISVPVYAEAVTITPDNGIVQSVENSLYQQLGLDLEKNYKIFYGAIDFKSNEKQEHPDRFIYKGAIYETVRNTNWFEYDGWSGVLAVEIKGLTPPQDDNNNQEESLSNDNQDGEQNI